MLKAPTSPAGSPPFAIAILRDVVAWVRALAAQPQKLPIYTVLTKPNAVDWDGCQIALTNGAAGRPTATSINGAWTYPDGSLV